MRLQGRSIHPGRAVGRALVSPAPLSFFGGVDPATGVVIERGHPLEGKTVQGAILCFPWGRGSTVGSYVLYALKMNAQAPLAIVNLRTEVIVAAGAILADIPCVDGVDVGCIPDGALVQVDAQSGEVIVDE